MCKPRLFPSKKGFALQSKTRGKVRPVVALLKRSRQREPRSRGRRYPGKQFSLLRPSLTALPTPSPPDPAAARKGKAHWSRHLQEASSVIVLAAPTPLLLAAGAIFPRRGRHLLHLPSDPTDPSPRMKTTPREVASLSHPLSAAAASEADMAAQHVTRGSRISGSRGYGAEVKGNAISVVDVSRWLRC